jgi:hypothetical protein
MFMLHKNIKGSDIYKIKNICVFQTGVQLICVVAPCRQLASTAYSQYQPQ